MLRARHSTWAAFVWILALLLSACTGGDAEPPTDEATAGATPVAPEVSDSASAGAAAGDDQDLAELYELAKEEGGELVFYSVMPQENASVVLAAFEEQFPEISVEQVDQTSEDLVARIIAEARGGAAIADLAHFGIDNVLALDEQDILLDWIPPEAQELPEDARGSNWVAVENQIWIGAWNTNLVSEEEAPDSFEDFADPVWRGRLIGEPRDWEMILAMVEKYDGDSERAIELFEQISENEPMFHQGHSSLTEMLVAGQAAACFTCYSHHYPPAIEDGAPLDYFLTEGVGKPAALTVLADAPHPNTAKLFARWLTSVEGQEALSEAGRIPIHPEVEPAEPVRPETVYIIGAEDVGATAPDGRTYEEIWQDIFGLR